MPRELTSEAALRSALVHEWPAYFAFLTSFTTVGIMWVNHHRLFTLIGRVDHWLLMLNLLLLLTICIVPVPTAIVAEYLGGEGAQIGRWCLVARSCLPRSCSMPCGVTPRTSVA